MANSDRPSWADDLPRAAAILRQARRVAVLTGAGISAESGVPTFRASDGLWEGHRIEDVATPRGFARDPRLVWRFYNARRANLRGVQPNPAHYALVELERRLPGDHFTLATQNVDTLHTLAGSQRVLELHGNIRRVRCSRCDYRADRQLEPLPDLPECPECGALLRPDIVWFYEPLPEAVWETAWLAVAQCDCLLVVGTSAVVHPAAGLIELAKQHDAAVIEVNLDQTAASHLADVSLLGKAGQILPQLVAASA
jgi:NAD-dependent deacetylase